MSLFTEAAVTCPNCEEAVVCQVVGSVNADRRPDLRDAILDDAFQVMTCDACGESFRLQPEFNLLDVGNGLWIAALPADRMPGYLAAEDAAAATFDQSYGAGAPAAGREIGAGLSARVTFGWPGLREKLVIRDAGLDDVTVELLKLDLLRRMPSAPLAPGTELRLIAVGDDGLDLAWQDTLSEARQKPMVAARELYDAIAENPEAWAPLREALNDGGFVDLQKLYMGEGRSAAE